MCSARWLLIRCIAVLALVGGVVTHQPAASVGADSLEIRELVGADVSSVEFPNHTTHPVQGIVRGRRAAVGGTDAHPSAWANTSWFGATTGALGFVLGALVLAAAAGGCACLPKPKGGLVRCRSFWKPVMLEV
jgi:hypothetical protein